MRTYRIAAIPGDGIGREVLPAALDVLRAAGAVRTPDLGGRGTTADVASAIVTALGESHEPAIHPPQTAAR